MRWIKFAICAIGLSGAHSAAAFVDCNQTIHSIFAGGDGAIYIFWVNGGGGMIRHKASESGTEPADPDFEPTLALATSALLSARPVVVRYADGTACNSWPPLIIGFELKR